MVHVPLMFLSEWREFPSVPCLAVKKKKMTAHISVLLKSLCRLTCLLSAYVTRKELQFGT